MDLINLTYIVYENAFEKSYNLWPLRWTLGFHARALLEASLMVDYSTGSKNHKALINHSRGELRHEQWLVSGDTQAMSGNMWAMKPKLVSVHDFKVYIINLALF